MANWTRKRVAGKLKRDPVSCPVRVRGGCRHYLAFCAPVLRSVLHFSWAHNPVEEQRTQNAADLTLSNFEPVPELLGTENSVPHGTSVKLHWVLNLHTHWFFNMMSIYHWTSHIRYIRDIYPLWWRPELIGTGFSPQGLVQWTPDLSLKTQCQPSRICA